MNSGDVRLIWFPFSRNQAEPYKKRPVLVINAVGTVPDRAILVAMITSNAQRFARPAVGDIPIVGWRSSGLLKPSVIRTRRLWTAEERDFSTQLGAVDEAVVKQACTEIRALLPPE